MGGRWSVNALMAVLRRLQKSRSAGYLLVTDGRSEKCFFFPVGAVRASSLGRRRVRDLETMLHDHPELTESNVEALLEWQRGDTGSGGIRAIDDPVFADGSAQRIVHACSKAIIRDELIDTIVWEGAQYEYRQGNPPPKLFDPRLRAVKLSTGVPMLLEEVLHKAEQWKSIASRFGVLRRLRIRRGEQAGVSCRGIEEDGAAEGVDIPRRLVAALQSVITDQGCGFDEAVLAGRAVGSDAIEVAQALLTLREHGCLVLESHSAEDGSSSRQPRMLRSEAEREIEEIESALELMVDALVARLRLADCYEIVGNKNKALEHLRAAGDELAERNRLEEALGVYRRVLTIKPRDFGVRERLVNLLQRARRMGEAIEEGLELAKQYQRFRLFNRAANVFRRLIAWSPKDTGLRRRLIEVLVKTEKTREAAAEYERLALLYAELEDEHAALACYQQLLALDPKHAGARKRLERFAKRSKAYVLPYLAVAAGYLLLLVGGYLVYDRYQDVRAFRTARLEAARLAEARDFTGARRVLSKVAVEHAVPEAKLAAMRKEIDLLEQYDREERAQELVREARAREARDAGSAARRLYAQVVARYGNTRVAEFAASRIRAIDRAEDQARRLLHQVELLKRDHKGAEEFEVVRKILKRYPGTDVARSIELPLEIRSLPSGALVHVDGRSVNARTPFELRRVIRKPLEVRLTLDGFEPWRRRLDPLDEQLSYALVARLQRRVRWRSNGVGPIVAAPWVDRELVVVGGADHRVRAFDPRGRLQWQRAVGLDTELNKQPVRIGEVILVATGGGRLQALAVADGTLRSEQSVARPIDAIVRLDDESGLLSYGGRLRCFDSHGRTHWELELGARALTAPVAVPGQRRLVCALADGTLALVGRDTGKLERRVRLDSRASARPAPCVGGVLVATEGGRLLRIRTDDAKTVWTKDLGAEAKIAGVACGGNQVFVVAGDRLSALAVDDATVQWQIALSAPVQAAPVSAYGKVLVADLGGALNAFSARDGRLLWRYRTGGPIHASPVLGEQTVYAVSSDFGLHAVID